MSAIDSPVDLAPFGLALGHATDADGATGLTVVRGIDASFRAAAAIVGRATGTRELHAASPAHLVDRVDAILLTGGSAYGLDAAAGVMRWMEERGRGFPVGAGVVPIVPAAVLFDLGPLGRFDARPTPAMAYDACDRAAPLVTEQGSVGAGTGATVGKALGAARAMKGGVGCVVVEGGGMRATGVAAVNAFGDVRDADGRIVAGARGENGFADTAAMLAAGVGGASRFGAASAASPDALQHTTLCLVAVDAPLGRQALAQLARAATAALYRRITPCGTTFDGDTVFAVSPLGTPIDDPALALRAESLAVRALEAAIERAVREAVGRDGIPGLADGS
ncbi:peptidase S58 DmpA [Gemmatirosa kalamazoonensis]|uniref:Peptidase S58 DmpA n=1 Tax=Gemmatirosa kalamazoonensis TaxID=861299 RepID=W0RIC3_9BACT|nr:P1 family peptidase [Gemmatirosa kalamazoonensis]AHG90085.1 peptidase S58 DmpA [Gemmatirosa kalamazoonensis]